MNLVVKDLSRGTRVARPCAGGAPLQEAIVRAELAVRYDYNHVQPHSLLGGLTPAARRSLELDKSSASDALAKPQTIDYGKTRLSP